MANLALIRGAAAAANEFIDVGAALQQPFLRAEQAFLRMQAVERVEKEKNENFRLQLLAKGDVLQTSKIAPEMQNYATGKAIELQQRFREIRT